MTGASNSNIRNFCIIAHVDHGKSTLADRILMHTGAVNPRDFKPQYLDKLDIERERGVTVKLQAVRLFHTAPDGVRYQLHLIDTPGHVDFTYEVSRSLKACEGALLVVDAAQGVQAQTIANFYLAKEQGLTVIPIINKIDLPAADVERVKDEIEYILDIDRREAVLTSAKEGIGIDEALRAVVERVPPPSPGEGPVRALIFDSHYDPYKGAIAYIRMISGRLSVNDEILLMADRNRFSVAELGCYSPEPMAVPTLGPGEVGTLAAAIKDIKDLHVGDTVTLAADPAAEPLPGYRAPQSMVYCGFFSADAEDYEELRDALEKLALNDSALLYEPEASDVLGFGFRCGFLGLFHMEIIQERLEREHGINLVATAPSTVYRIVMPGREPFEIRNPSDYPEGKKIDLVEEPYVRAVIFSPVEYVGAIMELTQEKRGEFVVMDYVTETRVKLTYEVPLSEIIFDYFDRLKSSTRGYASLNYELIGYRASDMVKLQILVAGKPVDALSTIVHKDQAYHRGRRIVERLLKLIPRHTFEVALQAAIGGKVVSRETIRALRKDVTAKCYGGDITRKRKLLEKQKEGKKRMKSVGSVEIPQEAFLAVLKVEK